MIKISLWIMTGFYRRPSLPVLCQTYLTIILYTISYIVPQRRIQPKMSWAGQCQGYVPLCVKVYCFYDAKTSLQIAIFPIGPAKICAIIQNRNSQVGNVNVNVIDFAIPQR